MKCPNCGSGKLKRGNQNLWCENCGFFPIADGRMIPDDLRSRVLAYYEQNKQAFLAFAQQLNSQRQFVIFPIMIDGVFDQIRYNVKEKRFDQIKVAIAADGITTSDMLPNGTVFANKIEFEVIEL